MSAINITELNAALGAYLRTHSDILVSETLLDQAFEQRFEVLDGVKDELPLPSLTISDLIQPANPLAFNPTGNALSFGSRIGKTRAIKVDLLIVPNVLEKTWLGAMKSKGSNPMDLPFEGFIMEQIAKKAKENLHLKSLYRGIYNGAGNTPADTMDGWLKLVADEIVAGKITPVVTGAITSANVEAKLLQVYDALGEAYKAGPVNMYVNPTIYDWYVRASRTAYGATQDYTGPQTALYGTLCTLVREAGLGSSQRVICTPKENMVYLIDSSSDSSNIRTQEFDRSIKVFMDFKAGVNFKEVHSRALSVNDQV